MLSPIAPLESPYVHAARAVRRTAAADAATAVAAQQAAEETARVNTVAAPTGIADTTPINQDLLRDQYADERMHRAITEYQPAAAQYSAAQSGSADALLPLQPYRVALGNPPVESFGAMLPPMTRRLNVPPVESAGLDGGFERARQRRRTAAGF
ncbi:Uncharacterised protein [Bordetella ansorpii]|uniref:Uncharacterized protein n=1 Tax=Bordetella ansorpii TaxID=288768 RepID=A0A157S4J3_9BORD|nr:hypothetical protein [Bordetella ansorpii]SAI65305.1 Uncharacterised protein [Bordetella ansorpii]